MPTATMETVHRAPIAQASSPAAQARKGASELRSHTKKEVDELAAEFEKYLDETGGILAF